MTAIEIVALPVLGLLLHYMRPPQLGSRSHNAVEELASLGRYLKAKVEAATRTVRGGGWVYAGGRGRG